MNKAKMYSLLTMLNLFISYLIMSYDVFEFNPMKWSLMDFIYFIGTWFVLDFCVFLFIKEYRKNN
jgi:hypothetical protein